MLKNRKLFFKNAQSYRSVFSFKSSENSHTNRTTWIAWYQSVCFSVVNVHKKVELSMFPSCLFENLLKVCFSIRVEHLSIRAWVKRMSSFGDIGLNSSTMVPLGHLIKDNCLRLKQLLHQFGMTINYRVLKIDLFFSTVSSVVGSLCISWHCQVVIVGSSTPSSVLLRCKLLRMLWIHQYVNPLFNEWNV